MRVTLVHPGVDYRRSAGALGRFLSPVPLLGIAQLAAGLEAAGHSVEVIDQFAEGLPPEALVDRIAAFRPGIVGFSVLTPNMGAVKEVLPGLRARVGAKVVLGNIHATRFHRELCARGEADVCARGEADETLPELVAAMERGGDLASVRGISFRTPGGEVVTTPPREAVRDIDSLPEPAWHLFDLALYSRDPMTASRRPVVPVQSSRGCAYSCDFCAQGEVFPGVRQRRIERVVDEMEGVADRLGVRDFGFIDAYFPLSRRQGLAFCAELRRRGLERRFTWIGETRVDKVDPELLREMAACGCRLLMYGIEAGDEFVLKESNKRTEVRQARDAVRWTKEAGILAMGLFIMGLPGDTRESCLRTAAFARELGLDIAKFNAAVPYPGSPFYERYRATPGAVDPLEEPERFSSWQLTGKGPVWAPPGMTTRELSWLQRSAMLRFYARPALVRQALARRSIDPADMLAGASALLRDGAAAATRRWGGRGGRT